MSNSRDYMAFISYRHADNAEEDKQWASWLHKQLETYEAPADLIGTNNLRGEPIPDRIFPVFLDELSLPADANLSSAITDALDRSRYLIVLCSPGAVASRYVNQEIQYFKQLGRHDEIMAALIEGEPNASIDSAKTEIADQPQTLECFPKALQYEVDEQGDLLESQPLEPIAANFRLPDGRKGFTSPQAFQKYLLSQHPKATKQDRARILKQTQAYEEQVNTAKLKVVAGILGVGLEQLTQRDKLYQLNKARAAARRARIVASSMAVLALVASIAGGIAYWQFKKADELLGQVRVTLNFLNYSVRDALKDYAPSSVRVPIMKHIDELVETLQAYGGKEDSRNIAAALVEKADLILLNDTLDPAEVLPLYKQTHEILLRLADKEPESTHAQQDLSLSHDRLGKILLRLGDTNAALNHYQVSLGIRQRLADKEPQKAPSQRSIAVSHKKLGDIYLRVGNTHKALGHYKSGIEIAQALVANDAENLQFQRDLSIFQNGLGDIQQQLGNTQAALDHYQAGLDVRRKVVVNDLLNLEARRDLLASHSKLGDIRQKLGNIQAALEHYQAGLEVAQGLAAKDPQSIQAQRDLSVCHDRLGEINQKQGHTQMALDHYQKGLSITQAIFEKDPLNTQAQHDLSIANRKIGYIQLLLENTQEALEHYQEGLAIVQLIVEKDPQNKQAQLDLSVSHNGLGDINQRLGNIQVALVHYQAGLEIAQAIVAKDSNNSQAQRDLSHSYSRLGETEQLLGNTHAALDHYQAGLEIIQALVVKDPKSAEFQRGLAVGLVKLGKTYSTLNQPQKTGSYYQAALNILLTLQATGRLEGVDEQYIPVLQNKINALTPQ